MSIKAKLLITISVLIALAFTTVGAVTVTVTRDRMVDRVDATLVTATGKPGRSGDERHDDQPGGYGKRATASIYYGPDGTVRFIDPSGFADDPDPLPDLDPDEFPARGDDIFTAGAVDGSDLRYRVLIRPMNDGGFRAVAAPLDDVDATVRGLTLVILVTGLAVLAVVVGAVWIIIRRGLQPIDNMVTTAGLIASGDLSHRVEHEDAATEVGKLGLALNAMLARIESSFAVKERSEQRLRQFVADASHELRTPLTSIRGYAELYRSGAAASPEGLARVMARIESEGARMGKLIEDLLLLARLDQGRPLERAPVDMARLLDDAVMDARVADPEHPITLVRAEEAFVLGDADRLRQVVDNLLSNARTHTERGTPIRVALALRGDDVVLTVADEGPGIAPDDAPHIYDRFYRADPSRARSSGGAGLGLSIVASIVDAHGGRVELDSTPGEGTTFTVVLSRTEPARPEAEALSAVATGGG